MTSILDKLREMVSGEVCIDDDTPDIVEDFQPEVTILREEALLEQFFDKVKKISEVKTLSEDEVFCLLMKEEKFNCSIDTDIEEFFWRTGISEKNVQILTRAVITHRDRPDEEPADE